MSAPHPPELLAFRKRALDARMQALMAKKQASDADLMAQASQEQTNFGEQLIQERMAHDEKVRKETQARKDKLAKAAGKEAPPPEPGLGEPGNNEPIIQPPQPINPQQPGAGQTMELGPQPGPPAAGQGQPMAAPPQATLPTSAQGLVGNVNPYLLQQTSREGIQRTPYGGRPTTEVTTRIAPNTLTAASAGELELGLRVTAMKDRATYYDRLALMGSAKDPASQAVFKDNVLRLARTDPSAINEIETRMGALEGANRNKGDLSPKTIYDPTSPTGKRLVNPVDAIGKPGPPNEIAQGLKGLGAAIGNGLARLYPTPTTTNKLQEQTLNATNALGRARNIYNSLDPRVFNIPSNWESSLAATGERLGMSIGPDMKEQIRSMAQSRQDLQENLSRLTLEMTGKVSRENEVQRIRDQIPDVNDSKTEAQAKLDHFYQNLILMTARTNWLLVNGLGGKSIDEALNQFPQLDMSVPEGANNMLKLLDQSETQAEMALRAKAAEQGITLNPKAVEDMATKATAEQFGLTPQDYQFLLQKGR